MVDQRKQAVSIRLGEGDLRNIKRMAQRLGVRDSDIIRFAVKSMRDRKRGRKCCAMHIEHGAARLPCRFRRGQESQEKGHALLRPRNPKMLFARVEPWRGRKVGHVNTCLRGDWLWKRRGVA